MKPSPGSPDARRFRVPVATTRHTVAAAAVCGWWLLAVVGGPVAWGQMGGMGGGGGGAPMPGGLEKPKFRDIRHEAEGLPIRRESGDAVVVGVKVLGNRIVGDHVISQKLQTRKDRFYDYETVLGDVRRLNEMGAFESVTFEEKKTEQGVFVTFRVTERPVISEVIFFGNRGMNERDLKGRSGLTAGDPLNQFSIESARRRLTDYYMEQGFNSVSIQTSLGGGQQGGKPGSVIFRINEGPKERIASINIRGNSIVSEARLKSIIKSREPMVGVLAYINNTADLKKIDDDVTLLQSYYHNLGFLTATVGRTLQYSEDGKWLTVEFVVNEGPRFTITGITILGNQYITEASLRERMTLETGDMFDGTLMRKDIGELIYGYGELGFIYADVEPKTIIRDEAGSVDLVYKITEGDRWKIGQIHVNIDGEPHLMKETTILNLMELREGDVIDRRKLENDQRRLGASPLLESNLSVADAPDIKVVPRDELK